MTTCEAMGHVWVTDDQRAGEGLICAVCHITEAEEEGR